MTKTNKKVLICLVALLFVTFLTNTTVFASTYTASEGTIYWESSDGCGSGKNASVSRENPYTEANSIEVSVDGYSILSEDGKILESKFEEKNFELDIPEVSEDEVLMLHTWGNGYRLGWIKATDLFFNEDSASDYIISEIPEGGEEKFLEDSDDEKKVDKTADTLKDELANDEKIPRESIILADFSGSMADFHEDVLEKLENESGSKYVFAEDIAEYAIGKDYDIGGATDIAKALNSLKLDSNLHIYILTDLEDNCGTKLEPYYDFFGEITIVYYPGDNTFAKGFFDSLREAYPNAKITGF